MSYLNRIAAPGDAQEGATFFLGSSSESGSSGYTNQQPILENNMTTHGPYVSRSSSSSSEPPSLEATVYIDGAEPSARIDRACSEPIPIYINSQPEDPFEIGNPGRMACFPSSDQEASSCTGQEIFIPMMNDQMTNWFGRLFTDLRQDDQFTESSSSSGSAYYSSTDNDIGRRMMVLPPGNGNSTVITTQPSASQNESTPLLGTSDDSSSCCRICPCYPK